MDIINRERRLTFYNKIGNYGEKLIVFLKRIKNLNKHDLKLFLKEFGRPVKYSIISILIVLILVPIATYTYFIRDLSSKERIINRKNQGVILLDREGVPFHTLFEARTRTTIPISQIPKHTQQAFIAVEDKEFYNHPGFSIRGILRAINTNIREEEFASGGSTISQQLIKNTLLSHNKNLLRKYQELVLAIELERKYTKDDILELYLNTIYFGEKAFGIEEASQRYFSKKASQLTLAESTLLAAIIRAPSTLSPLSGDREKAIERAKLVLGLMREQGYITESEEENAKEQDIRLNPKEKDVKDLAIHFALMVQDFLIKEYGEQRVAQSGFVVKTTLDRNLQERAEAAVSAQVLRLRRNKVSNGAAVAIDPKTGEVLMLVGSHDWDNEINGKINMAISPRQPGSSFKPIIYAKALEERIITPATVLQDKPVSFGTYKPKNYDGKFRGQVLVRKALANSLNIPSVHVMNRVGIREGMRMATDLGITTIKDEKNYGLSLVLGAAEVPLIEMTNAYAVFANKGDFTPYILYKEVRDKNNNIILRSDNRSHNVLSEAVAFLISSILSDNKARQEVFGNSLTISREAAVKTGTTENYRDALTIGYTPQIVVGTWVGNNDNTPMDSVAGSLGAAPIWRIIMENYLRSKPIEKFTKPANVLEMSICSENGLKSEVATSSALTEFFLRGTLPTRACNTASPTPLRSGDSEDEDEKKEEPTPTSSTAEEPTPVPTIEVVPTETATSGGIINFSL